MSEPKRETWEHVAKVTAAFNRQSEELRSLQAVVDLLRKLLPPIVDGDDAVHVLGLLSDVLLGLRDTVGAEEASLLAADEEAKELVFVVVHGGVAEADLVWRRIPMGRGVAGWVAKNRRSAIVNSVAGDDRFLPDIDQEFEHKTRSLVAAPLVHGDRVLGVVEVLNKRNGGLFVVRDETLVRVFAELAANALGGIEAEDIDLSSTYARVARSGLF